MVISWWSAWWQVVRQARARRRPGPSPRRASCRPTLEFLELRLAPSGGLHDADPVDISGGDHPNTTHHVLVVQTSHSGGGPSGGGQTSGGSGGGGGPGGGPGYPLPPTTGPTPTGSLVGMPTPVTVPVSSTSSTVSVTPILVNGSKGGPSVAPTHTTPGTPVVVLKTH